MLKFFKIDLYIIYFKLNDIAVEYWTMELIKQIKLN